MKKFLFSILICLLVFSGLFVNNNRIVSTETTPSGKEEVEIWEADFFSDFYNNPDLLGESGKNYIVKIKENINLQEAFTTGKPFTFTPIGSEDEPFTAEIDGCGNLFFDFSVPAQDNDMALFGYFSGTIKNLKLSNIHMESSANSAVLAVNATDATIENIILEGCFVSGINVAGLIYNAVNVTIRSAALNITYTFNTDGYPIVCLYDNDTSVENVVWNFIDGIPVTDNIERINDDFDEEDFINNFGKTESEEDEESEDEELPITPSASEPERDEQIVNNSGNYLYTSNNNQLIFKLITLLNRMPFLRVAMFLTPLLVYNMFL